MCPAGKYEWASRLTEHHGASLGISFGPISYSGSKLAKTGSSSESLNYELDYDSIKDLPPCHSCISPGIECPLGSNLAEEFGVLRREMLQVAKSAEETQEELEAIKAQAEAAKHVYQDTESKRRESIIRDMDSAERLEVLLSKQVLANSEVIHV